ncbi:MAG: UTP--glucose-1-phosphate uridylyltransferase [Proteobacteria bacterium]|nr:UTP--glucose-1-phosphate uridylyltransferase [Pseudomonadota bacterium]
MKARSVTTVVIPVAGLGTRFLPETKVIPKEMLPIIDTPIIHHIVEEAVEAGMTDVVFITSRPKVLIEDYFDPHDLISFKLKEVQKYELIQKTLKLTQKIRITSIRQYEPLGLGHAILQAAPFIGTDNFAVLLGDEVDIATKKNGLKDCVTKFKEINAGSVIGVQEVPHEEVSKYGVVEFNDQFSISRFIEKPQPSETTSSWIIPGRYVFENQILNELSSTQPGRGGEIQLTDAMLSLLDTRPFFAQEISGERYDTGSKLGFILANLAQALKDPKLKKPILEFLENHLKSAAQRS